METIIAGRKQLLEVSEVTVRYGGVTAVDSVSFDVAVGSLIGLIGPNGAGKTSLIDALTGYTPIDGGSIRFDGLELGGVPAYKRSRSGLARTFQSVELFDDLTVEENLLVASEGSGISKALRDLFLPARKADRSAVDWALSACGLEALAKKHPTQISHGQRKLVGLARALARRPKMLLLDEPAAGLDTDESTELGERLRALPKDEGVTILLIDHDMGLVLSVSDQVYVLNFGRLISSGTPEHVRDDSAVVEAYLGRKELGGVD